MTDPCLIQIPKESVSDDTVLLARWLVANGEKVNRGAAVAIIETSKSAIDIESTADGFLHHMANEGDQLPVGAPIGSITVTPEAPTARTTGARIATSRAESAMPDVQFSKAARKMIAERGLDPKDFAHLSLVRREDVELRLRKAAPAVSTLIADLPIPGPKDVILWGGGGHAKVCIEIIRAAGKLSLYGILDFTLPVGSSVLGVPVIGSDTALEEIRSRGVTSAVLGIGAVFSHSSRSALLQRLREAGYELPNIVHPRAVVDPSAKMGGGSVVFAHATVGADAAIGDGCIINSGAVVSHDCRLGHNVHLAPGALLAGWVVVGNNTLVGMGAAIFWRTKIGSGVTINNGAIVDQDVPEGQIVYRQ